MESPPTCVLTGAPGENPDDCTTHNHESVYSEEYDEEPDDPEDGLGTWSKNEIFSETDPNAFVDEDVVGRGPVLVRMSTNDNYDVGYPSEYASWYCRYATVKDAVKSVGVCRYGFAGCKVDVFLDGERLTREMAEVKGLL
jgi:hypothetical protein